MVWENNIEAINARCLQHYLSLRIRKWVALTWSNVYGLRQGLLGAVAGFEGVEACGVEDGRITANHIKKPSRTQKRA